MSSSLLPEFFTLLGIDMFLAISLLTCLLDRHFPMATPYIYQVAALAGFGQLWVGYAFLFVFSLETRFWCSIIYLIVAVANVIAVNFYVAVLRKLVTLGGGILGAVTLPTTLMAFFTVSSYVNGVAVSIPLLPVVPIETVYAILVVCAAILGVGIMASLKPGMFGKIRSRQPAKQVEEELTKALREVGEDIREWRKARASQSAPVTRKPMRLTPEMLIKIKKEKEVK